MGITGWSKKPNLEKENDFYKETGAKLSSIPAFIKKIIYELKDEKNKLSKKAVPEKYPLLRAMQYAIWVGLENELKLK